MNKPKVSYAFIVNQRDGFINVVRLDGSLLITVESKAQAEHIIELLDAAYEDGYYRAYSALNERRIRHADLGDGIR
jgi:hypothetical protein